MTTQLKIPVNPCRNLLPKHLLQFSQPHLIMLALNNYPPPMGRIPSYRCNSTATEAFWRTKGTNGEVL
jgi:hypothetical protein